MHDLLAHYKAMRLRCPGDTLAIVFDIDGTIIDTRHLMRQTLLGFDSANGTTLFASLEVDDIEVHEAELDALLDRLGVSEHRRPQISKYYFERLWHGDSMRAAHTPYQGVMDIIRWFQLQPMTKVVLNTGRNEGLRQATLRAMNELGREYRVNFPGHALYMNPGGIGENVAARKAEVLQQIRTAGMRVCAVIDNEPENLESMARADADDEIIFLHANTIFLSARRPLARSSSGRDYDLGPFTDPALLPRHVQLVLDGVTTVDATERCLVSAVEWLGMPVRSDAYGRPVIGEDSDRNGASRIPLRDALEMVVDSNRSVRLDLRQSVVVAQVVSSVHDCELAPARLWFAGELHQLSERGTRQLREHFPEATVSCRIDFLAPLVFGALEHALDMLKVLTQWGITRLDLDWRVPKARTLISELERWGYSVNICGVTDPENLLQAALLHPASVSAAHTAVIGSR